MRRWFANKLLFHPTRGQSRTPSALGLDFEAHSEREHGFDIAAWWIPAAARGPALVMFHGNAGTMADRLENVQQLIARLGVSVLTVEYPGYGDCRARPSEEALYAAGVAGCRLAARLAAGRPLIAFGRSLGGAVAIDAAARFQSRGRLAGLVVESTFTSLSDMGRHLRLPGARWLSPYRLDSRAKIEHGRVRCPLLIIHGDADELVPYAMGEALQRAAARRDLTCELHTVAGGQHNDTWVRGGDAYWAAWSRFLGIVT